MIIDRLIKTNLDKETSKECLIQRENFWIQKLKTLYHERRNHVVHSPFKTDLSEAVAARKI